MELRAELLQSFVQSFYGVSCRAFTDLRVELCVELRVELRVGLW